MAITTLRWGGVRPDLRVLPVREWARADTDSGIPRMVPIVAVSLALIGTLWAWLSGSLVLYGDARAHLDIARHVTDGITPGLAQLGSVWLPLQHVLLVPLVAVGFLWHSGLAGSMVGGACFVYSAVRTFSLGQELLGGRRCGWTAFLLYAGNINLLFVQGTALTEPVLLAFFVGAAYRLSRWMRTMSHDDLIIAAALTCCASLTRYDGWFLLLVAVLVVGLWSRARERRQGATEANVVIFAAVGAFGIVVWLLYNLVIFHDPLFFIHSNFSAQSQQASLQQVGALTTKGSVGTSAATYGWAIADVAGGALAALGVLGVLDLVVGRGMRWSRSTAAVAILASPVLFNIVALWAGQSTLRIPQVAPFGLWNVRYGLMALPLLAIGGAALVRRNGIDQRTVLLIAAVGAALMAIQTPITLTDGRSGTASAAGGHPELAAQYLRQHYAGGKVLTDEGSSAPLVFASNLDLTDFVTNGSHPYYENALAKPSSNVRWIVAFEGDAISADLQAHPQRFTGYKTVIVDGRVRLLERKTS